MNTQIGIPAPRVAPSEKEVEALAEALYLWRSRVYEWGFERGRGRRLDEQARRHEYFVLSFRMGYPDWSVKYDWRPDHV